MIVVWKFVVKYYEMKYDQGTDVININLHL